jgi:glycosyltransferase involved in cell wall biosynthesis
MPSFVDDVFVIDDGSDDRTGSVAREAHCSAQRCTVMAHEANRGVGAAIATGYAAALASGCDVVAVMAGDGQMDPSDLEAVIGPVARGECDYAKGNRLAHPSVLRAMPFTRLVGNIVLSNLTRLATGLRHVNDSQCGYTAIHRRVLTALDPAAMWARYGYPNHLLGALARTGHRVADVVVRPVYAGERSGVRFRDAVVTIPRILAAIALARVTERRREPLPAPRGFVEIR